MKKTLLAIAILLSSTCVFAQVNRNINAIPTGKKAANLSTKVTVKPSAKRTIAVTKANPDGSTLLCDFSNADAYTFGKTSRHQTIGFGWNLQADTNTAVDVSTYLGYVLHQNGYSLLTDAGYCNMSAQNGFAYITPYEAYGGSVNEQNTVWETWVRCNTPIFTKTLGSVDIYLNQLGRRFNSDRYYIDWCRDSLFADGTYDSIEFNVKGTDYNANDWMLGEVRVNLPSGTTHCNIIAPNATDKTFIRIRFYAPASQYQPHGYFWAIDDIAYEQAPATRLDVLDQHFYGGGYHVIPSPITTDTLIWAGSVANTGIDSLTNVIAKNNISSATATSDTTYSYTFIKSNQSNPMGLTTAYYNDSVTTSAGTVEEINLRRAHELDAASNTLASGTKGLYQVTSEITYTNAATSATGRKEIKDSLFYEVVDTLAMSSNNTYGNYRWAKDRDALAKNNMWTYGFITENGNNYITEEAAYTTAGYKTCISYEASQVSSPLYIKGVEVVPAFDSCQSGMAIKGSLKMWSNDPDATADNVIIDATDANGNPIESTPYVVQTSDLNSSTGVTYASRNYTSIYLPFNVASCPALTAGQRYYACYELVTSGKFAVGENPARIYHFGPGSAWNTLIWSPGVSSSFQLGWGGMYYYPSYSDFHTPMIRLYVSANQTNPVVGLNDVSATAAQMSLYPNPAVNNTVVNYTLNQSGNVTLKVTDLMGRTVLTMDRGNENAGITYKANVNVSSLNNGTYFCTLYVNGAKSTSKFVVNK